MCIIYVGNYIVEEEKSKALISRSVRFTGVNEQSLLSRLEECEYTDDTEEAYRIGEIVRDYLLLLLKNDNMDTSVFHWLTLKMKGYADEFFKNDISLKYLAQMYNKNEKYMGRIFREDMGLSFNEYCNSLRLRRAEELLLSTSEKVIDIAFSCGFNTVSYFNRVFKNRHGVSPIEYRKHGEDNG